MAKNKKDKVKNKFFVNRWVVRELINSQYMVQTKNGEAIVQCFKSQLDITPTLFKSKIKAKVAMKWYIFDKSNKEGYDKYMYQLVKVCVPRVLK